MVKKKTNTTLRRIWMLVKSFPFVLIMFGMIGAASSTIISIEKFHLVENPGVKLDCDLNPVYSCGNIINSDQSSLFGVSNELVGLFMFTVLITTGVVMLAGAKMKDWYWKLFLLGMGAFVLSIGWFFYQSVYVLNFLCIYCSIVWFSGWAITTRGYAWVYDQKILPRNKLTTTVREFAFLIWFLVIVLAIVLVLEHFWYYYGQYFPF
jgi:uncharacterized membrane protein